MSTPTNQAAWLSASKQKPFDVKSIPFPSPSPTEIVIHNHAVAINPVDWKVQDYDFFIQSYPFVLGEDGAGTVHSVGSAVTGFAPGDRVLAHYNGLGNQQASNSSFATYAKTTQTLVAKIPDAVSFTDASVLPLAISTAAAGLFQKGFLELPFPLAGGKAQKTGKVLLVWGGSSSVGSAAIQLAVAAGVDVAATASARNHEFVKSLGAKYVFDHTSGSVAEDIVKGLQGAGEFAGVYDAISLEDTVRKTAEVTRKLGGKQLIATVLDAPAGAAGDVATKNVFAITIADNEVGPAVWGKFVPEALKDGSLKTAPDALVVGKGLEKIQEGCDKNKAGVSAKKVVVELA